MLKVVVWTFALYGALKLCRLVLGGSKGWDGEPTPVSTRIRAGEPALLIGTVTIVAALMLFTHWWLHKFAARHYARATSCYPRLAAAGYLPDAPARFRSYDAAEDVGQLREDAEEHGAALGIARAEIDARLERSRRAYVARNRGLAPPDDRRTIAAALADADRCLTGEGRPRGDIFNP
jgi:hypothetical protein